MKRLVNSVRVAHSPILPQSRPSLNLIAILATTVACLLLAACGSGNSGGSGSSSAASSTGTTAVTGSLVSAPAPGVITAPSPPQAARFLTQSTFGPRLQDISALTTSNETDWIAQQQSVATTSQLAQLQAFPDATSRNNRMTVWWNTVVTAPDQLRQRMAFALSEIFVISDQASTLVNNASALASYWDLLANDSFGNFRTLLEDVTLNPAMGVYLNMRGNEKPNPALNIHADENYAREVMQLFTIGLYQLNPDGTVVTDSAGVPVPSYTQADVTNLARVFTGWSWNASGFYYATPNYLVPMIPFEAEHDSDAKTIVGNVSVPAGGTSRADLKIALDTLFNHPNTGPFVSKQLIQRFVTSNPSPAYVARVAQVFANNGQGVRGDLGAVVKAILLDSEARADMSAQAASFGKRREPLLTVSHLWRALDGRDSTGNHLYWNPEFTLHEAPLSAGSVFNFYKPGYSPAGLSQRAGNPLVAPEFQLVTASDLTELNNTYVSGILNAKQTVYTQPTDILLHPDAFLSLATGTDSGPLIDQLNLVLLSGQMTAAMRQAIVTDVNQISASDGGLGRVLEATYLIFSSPQYQIQK